MPLECLLGGIESPVKCLFSLGSEPAGAEWKSAVIERTRQRARALLPVSCRWQLPWLDGRDVDEEVTVDGLVHRWWEAKV